MRDALLPGKLCAPPRRLRSVLSLRLIARLNDAALQGYRLILVLAPPGDGNSAPLVERLLARGEPFAWLSLDSGDDDARRFFIHLDDSHAITSPGIHHVLAVLPDQHLPPVRLALATREDPPPPLARLRVRGLLTEIRAADPRFVTEEATICFNRTRGLCLGAPVAALDARTEGWSAGPQLAA